MIPLPLVIPLPLLIPLPLVIPLATLPGVSGCWPCPEAAAAGSSEHGQLHFFLVWSMHAKCLDWLADLTVLVHVHTYQPDAHS